MKAEEELWARESTSRRHPAATCPRGPSRVPGSGPRGAPGRASDGDARVLVVEDDPAMREVLRLRFRQWGCRVEVAASAEEARERLSEKNADLVLSDLVLPGSSGMSLVRLLEGCRPRPPLVLISAHGTVPVAVEAMKLGALDFLTKPLDYERLQRLVQSLSLRDRQPARAPLGTRARLLGQSRAMAEVRELIARIASCDAPVLITGESGTGKEVAARAIHDLSPRAGGPWVAINCAALPAQLVESELFGHEKGAFTGAMRRRRGAFELADRGTLFLDEIGEMPVPLQAKLLRVLEQGSLRPLGGERERRMDVRLLAATNRDPRESMEAGCLRLDLYYRLNVLPLHLPPLRQRPEDILPLARHFLEDCNRRHQCRVEGFGPDVLERWRDEPWPGNVRELRNVVERAVLLARSGWITPDHLPSALPSPRAASLVLPCDVSAAEAERRLILHTLERVGHNKAEAARRLGLDVKTIRNKLKAYRSRVKPPEGGASGAAAS